MIFKEILYVFGPVSQFFWDLLFLQVGSKTEIFLMLPLKKYCAVALFHGNSLSLSIVHTCILIFYFNTHIQYGRLLVALGTLISNVLINF